MGHGIAQVAAGAGYKVLLRDVDRDSLARGIEAIERNLAKGIRLGKLTEACNTFAELLGWKRSQTLT